MVESVFSLTALFLSTSALILHVSSLASKEWVGDTLESKLGDEEIMCALSGCCIKTRLLGARSGCFSGPESANSILGVNPDVSDGDFQSAIVFSVLAVCVGTLAWGFSLRCTLSDRTDGYFTASIFSALQALLVIIAIGVFASSNIEDDIEAYTEDGANFKRAGNFSVEYQWGFWVGVASIVAAAFAAIFYAVSGFASRSSNSAKTTESAV